MILARRNPISGGHTRTFAIQRIVQKRTPSLREPSLQRSMLKRLAQFANPRMWRTVETLAVASVFCMMIGVSLRRVSPLRGNSFAAGYGRGANCPLEHAASGNGACQEAI